MTTATETERGVDVVDFVCIGAQKSGTTYVSSAFRAHPEVQMPVAKELHFFSPKGEYRTEGGFAQCNADRSIDWYKQQFVEDGCKKGEVSTHYIYDPASAARIKSAFPDIRIFAIIRNPVDRAFSQYNMEKYKTCKEARDLLQIIEEEPDNEILARGLYARQLSPFLDEFDEDRIRVYLFDEMISEPEKFFRDIFGFLGVDTTFLPPGRNIRMNKSRKTRYEFIPRAARGIRKFMEAIGLKSMVRALVNAGAGTHFSRLNERYNQVTIDFELTPQESAALQDYYAADIELLEQLLNRDLSHWKTRT